MSVKRNIIILFCFLFSFTVCCRTTSVSDQADDLWKKFVECQDSTERANLETMILLQTDKGVSLLDGLFFYSKLGEYYLAANNKEKTIDYLERGRQLLSVNADKIDKADFFAYNPVATIYNDLAICAINYEMNFRKATGYFIQALESARKYQNQREFVVIGSNLLMNYWIKANPNGLYYANDIYKQSLESDDPLVKYIGAFGMALMYYTARDYDQAEKYLLESNQYIPLEEDRLGALVIYANILYRKGLYVEAERYFKLAMSHLKTKAAPVVCYTFLSYGDYLKDSGMIQEAKKVLNQGLEVAGKLNNQAFTYRLYYALSDVCRRQNDWKGAYEAYQLYAQLSDSIFNIENEWSINELLVKYQTVEKERMLKNAEVELVKKNRALWVVGVFIACVGIVALILYYMYVSKNRMLRTIVRQYKESIQTENRLRKRISELESIQEEKDAMVIKEEDATDKIRELFDRVEFLMKQQKVYRDQSLTREKMAELAETNRTYLTKAVKDYADKSFSQYVNSFRIKEALEILSDVGNQTPLKAVAYETGFSSVNTFYKLFKEEVGMTPATYRTKILELDSE